MGGLRLTGDETGDAHLFTQRLAAICEGLGVTFRYNVTVTGLQASGGRVTGVACGSEVLHADAYVAAMGSFTPALLRPLGLNLPIYRSRAIP